ncbi:MAG TPA: response regulator transcription factor [Pyrinomonadaceae bacterium]|jgi:DNA-binding NarL/FixJ family response regulator|nr:response regulator transcription factor [Pyrinomonadaceae bacterium]
MEPAPQKIRLLIVNDQLVVREGLRLLIENHPGIKVVSMASSPAEAIEIAARETIDLIVLDLELGGRSALSCIPQLRASAKTAPVLVLTGLRNSEVHQQAVQLGAMGVVLKEDAADRLIKAIRKVYEGEVWLDRLSLGSLLSQLSTRDKASTDPEKRKISSLTDRERQVITLIATGLKNKQIAERLFISHTTVAHHLSSIYSKLGVSDRLELVVYAFANKLAQRPE